MNTYNYNEVYNETLKYFNGDDLAAKVWINKYCLKNKAGELMELSPDDMHIRLAKEFSRIEEKYKNSISYDELYFLFKNFKYIIPQGRPMAGIGNPYQIQSISNCFLAPTPNDNYTSILKTDAVIAQIYKMGGGNGINISKLRPSGSATSNSPNGIEGATTYMERYSYTTGEVCQNNRRGALMLCMNVEHPDIAKFITKKIDKNNKVKNANISVALTDDFMKAVVSDGDFDLKFENKIYTTVKAREIFRLIADVAWKSAEPGVLFWDMIKTSPADCYDNYKTEGTNPCGEITLSPYDSCRLLAMNLFSYVKNPFTNDSYLDFELLSKHAYIAQKIMDDLVDLEIEKIEQILEKVQNDNVSEEDKQLELEIWTKIKEVGKNGRRTGLGYTALGDALAGLGLRYGTKEATEKALEIQKCISLNSYKSSIDMAEERGCFNEFSFEKEKDNLFIQNIINQLGDDYVEKYKKYGRRNIANLTIAPTGTVSIMSQTTSGIEPCFMPAYTRRVRTEDKNKATFIDNSGVMFTENNVIHHKLKMWYEINYPDNQPIETLKYDELTEIIKTSPYYKATSNDVNWIEKVQMQGELQKYIDHSISVTVNLPETTSVEMIENIYKTAWESGCKGCTIYRNGSLDGVLVSTKTDVNEKCDCVSDTEAIKRPKKLKARIARFNNNKEKWIALIGLHNDRPYEIFTGLLEKLDIPPYVEEGEIVKIIEDESKTYSFVYKNKEGKDTYVHHLDKAFNPEYWNYARLVSSMLRYRIPLTVVVKMINDMKWDNEKINTWKNGVVRAIKPYISNGVKSGVKCSKCDSELVFEGGCLICKNCGESKCG